MTKIVFFVPYPDILPVTEQVFRERPGSGAIRYEIVQDYYNNTLERAEADVVMARGFTAHTLKRRNIPCAELKSTGYGVMKAVDQYMQKGSIERIAVVGAFNMVYGAEQMCHLYPNLGLGYYAEDDEIKLKMAVHQAMEDGNQAIVGGYSTVQIAERLGVPAAMIYSGIEAVNHAISEATAMAHLTRYERQKRDEIADTMNYSFQGIISVNRKRIITLTNTCCYTYMKDRKTSLAREHTRGFSLDIDFDSVIRDKQKIPSEVCRFGGKQVLVSCAPVASDSKEFGCVFIFQGAEQIQAEEEKLRKRMHLDGSTTKCDFPHILYRDNCMEAAISQAVKLNYSDSNILIHEETETGKELFAQSIHNSSRRRKGPFVAINCMASPENLLESEPLGCVEGAFIGASKGGKMGFFEIAHKGTIFLDEIGDISSKLQNRLLRVIQERKIIRLGNDTVIPTDVHVICVTNRGLKKEVVRGSFRENLLYRLDVLELNLSPLRKRKQDILYLADRMVRFEHERIGSRPEAILQKGRKLLMRYSQPGSVREMRNLCERICILCEKTRARAEDAFQVLPGEWEHGETADSRHADGGFGSTCFQASGSHVTASAAGRHAPRLGDAQRQAMEDALELCGYHRGRTAACLGIDKSTLWRKMKKYGIEGQADDKERQVQGMPGLRNARHKV